LSRSCRPLNGEFHHRRDCANGHREFPDCALLRAPRRPIVSLGRTTRAGGRFPQTSCDALGGTSS
jgi:hypothetical protein